MNRMSCKLGLVATLLALALAGCGGGQEATPAAAEGNTPTAATADATVAATATVAASETSGDPEMDSPLAAPASPLAQPPSPLPTVVQGPHIEIAVPSDIGVITQLAQDTQSPQPQAGKAALSGVLYSPVVNRIIPGTQFYLTPAIEDDGQLFIPSLFDGPKEAEGDVAGISNEFGQILLDNVPPGNYYLAVWTIYNWPLAFGAADAELPLLITVEAGDKQDLGLLYVEWP